MAVPTQLNPDQSLYIVSLEMASGFRGHGWDEGDFMRHIQYKFPLAKRQEIGALRQKINVVRNAGCFKFFKNYVTNDIGKEQLERACREVDTEMKKLDGTLHVTPMFFKLDAPALKQGNILTAMTEQLRDQVHERVLKRIEQTIADAGEDAGGKLAPKTKKALLRMLDKTAEINVLGDTEVTARIEAMKAQIEADAIIPLRNEILAILEEDSDALEFMDPAAKAEQPAQKDTDETKYDAKPAPQITHVDGEDLIDPRLVADDDDFISFKD